LSRACSGKTLSSILGDTRLQLLAQQIVVEVSADQHELVFSITGPFGVVNGKTLTSEVEDMALLAFVEPKNALRPEHFLGHLIVEEILKFPQSKWAFAFER
jgi:hypothetical protein